MIKEFLRVFSFRQKAYIFLLCLLTIWGVVSLNGAIFGGAFLGWAFVGTVFVSRYPWGKRAAEAARERLRRPKPAGSTRPAERSDDTLRL